jgi:hypothetical protein
MPCALEDFRLLDVKDRDRAHSVFCALAELPASMKTGA